MFGATNLKHLIETTNGSWIKSIPVIKGNAPPPRYGAVFYSSKEKLMSFF